MLRIGGSLSEKKYVNSSNAAKGIPLTEEDLGPKLVEILKSEFAANDRKKSIRKKDVNASNAAKN